MTCRRRGEHFCEPRADHAQAFIEEICLHTKGRYARTPFILCDWQRDDIVRPLFGQVVWSGEQESYVRRYRIAWIELARKNGKSELLAAIMLYLLVADGEESAELFGVGRDRDQAALVFDVAKRMVQLSPILSKRLQVKDHNKRIIDPKTASVYAVIAADAAGALGSNPSGVAADEILAWRDRAMWDAMRTGMGSGARRQPLMIAATTAGSDTAGFAGQMHAEMQRVAEDPGRAAHVFVYLRNTPQDADPFDESTWPFANPALGDFLSIEAMRQEAQEARNNPAQENSFRQFRLNQWVGQASRWMPMHLYDASAGELWPSLEHGREFLAGRECWVGFDLAAKFDLTAWCLLFPDGDGGVDVLWRFWLPEAALPLLDKHTDGQMSRWVRDGWVTVTDGNVVDYQRIYSDVEDDAALFDILGADGDQWSSMPVVQELSVRTNLDPDEGSIVVYTNTYTHMSPGMDMVMGWVKDERFRHHGNPVARWCFDSVEVRKAPYDPALIRPDKPDRGASAKRIDAVPAAAMAANALMSRGDTVGDEFEYDGFAVYN
ncbi:terminase large subunit [Kutzneria albida]|uniref:terminase large subunit n=1 Tax=Kutzneria albida TaxID=43357 RepID=UPI001F1C53BA|nr:terminase TerL endonuclease subunit [Kutzneria albida]